MGQWSCSRKRLPQPKCQAIQGMVNKDCMADHKKQQACEGNTNQSLTAPLGPAIQGKKDRHAGRHNKTL